MLQTPPWWVLSNQRFSSATARWRRGINSEADLLFPFRNVTSWR